MTTCVSKKGSSDEDLPANGVDGGMFPQREEARFQKNGGKGWRTDTNKRVREELPAG